MIYISHGHWLSGKRDRSACHRLLGSLKQGCPDKLLRQWVMTRKGIYFYFLSEPKPVSKPFFFFALHQLSNQHWRGCPSRGHQFELNACGMVQMICIVLFWILLNRYVYCLWQFYEFWAFKYCGIVTVYS